MKQNLRTINGNYIYLTGKLYEAVLGAELAVGDGCGRIYIVESLDAFENDPNFTDDYFPEILPDLIAPSHH